MTLIYFNYHALAQVRFRLGNDAQNAEKNSEHNRPSLEQVYLEYF